MVKTFVEVGGCKEISLVVNCITLRIIGPSKAFCVILRTLNHTTPLRHTGLEGPRSICLRELTTLVVSFFLNVYPYLGK